MAVYTPLADADVDALLRDYDLGRLDRLEGILAGVENSNFHLYTERGRWILTVFERRVREKDLPYFLSLVDHVARRGVRSPAPVARRGGGFIGRIAGKPCVISTYLPGEARMSPDEAECEAAGAALAALHDAASDFPQARANDLSLQGWKHLAAACGVDADRCGPGLAALIADEIAFLGSRWPRDLPGGACHLDLFPDNVFFSGASVSGVIDFYFAATDAYAYDLAVAALAFASDKGRLDRRRVDAVLYGYTNARDMSVKEMFAMHVLMRGAATRFLLTRLYDWLNRVEGA
ncbi:MAG: homoserine kinase, partial [Parvularculaceae bacterium]|nr:homoserine kinase [Parvularculaceae bacterium]